MEPDKKRGERGDRGERGGKKEEITAEGYAKQVLAIEEEIASLTVRISETERAIERIEIDSLNLLKLWSEQSDEKVDDKERESRKKQIFDLCDKEKGFDRIYEDLRKERDEKIRDLRLKYLDYIKRSHMEKESPDKDKKAKAAPELSLHHSSLISGTSQSGMDDVDYNRIFKKWEFDTSEIDVDKKPPSKEDKKTMLDRKGPVFHVTQVTVMNKDVCLKKFIHSNLNPNEKERQKAIDETIANYKQLKSQLGHPNLLAPIGAIVENKHEAIIVELARNNCRSLEDVLHSLTESTDKKVRLGFPRKLYIMKSITSALSWIHEHQKSATINFHSLHLRLKPSNILFTSDWKVKVADYGLNLPQVYLDPAKAEKILFERKYAHYTAPEIYETATPKPNQAADGWSLGMIFYTLLTDKIPFEDAKDFGEVKSAILNKKLPPLPKNTPKTLSDIIHNCWAYSPADRATPKKIADSEPWGNIFKEATTEGAASAKKIWEEAIKKIGEELKTIPWDKFAPVLWENLGLKNLDINTSKEALCLKELIRVQGDQVRLDFFSDFARTFSPLRTGESEGPAYVSSIVKLCQLGWFYGVKNRVEVESMFNTPEAKKAGKSGVVLRITVSEGFKFCLGIIAPNGQLQQIIVPPEMYAEKETDFYHHFTSDIKKKKLTPIVIASENPFAKFFDSNFKTLKYKTTAVGGASDGSVLSRSTAMTASGTGLYIT
jgi:hypothetical protein